MAITAEVSTIHGEQRRLYIRLNNIETSNHGVQSVAKFRGFISRDDFLDGAHYMWEVDIFFSADVSLPLWSQAYDHLKTIPEFADATDC